MSSKNKSKHNVSKYFFKTVFVILNRLARGIHNNTFRDKSNYSVKNHKASVESNSNKFYSNKQKQTFKLYPD